MIAPQWSVKGEFLYYDLGTLSTTLPQLNAAAAPFFGAKRFFQRSRQGQHCSRRCELSFLTSGLATASSENCGNAFSPFWPRAP
jgi:hypothetical protein